MDHGSMGHGGGTACKVNMLWNWDTVDACFIASSWRISNNGMMAATCIGVVLMSMVLEFLRRLGKEYDGYLTRQFQRHAASQMRSQGPSLVPGSCTTDPTAPMTVTYRASLLQQLMRAVIHGVTFGLAYLIMILVMYCNGYIIICVILGAGIGKFLCDWMVVKIHLEALQPAKSPEGITEPTVCCG